MFHVPFLHWQLDNLFTEHVIGVSFHDRIDTGGAILGDSGHRCAAFHVGKRRSVGEVGQLLSSVDRSMMVRVIIQLLTELYVSLSLHIVDGGKVRQLYIRFNFILFSILIKVVNDLF